MATQLENEFDQAMVGLCDRACVEAGYSGTELRDMVAERGGLNAARILLEDLAVSEGFRALWQRNRLDLTVEALVLIPKWRDLFGDAELATARQRLAKCLRDDAPRNGGIRAAAPLNRITINPAQCGGRPCVRGMRIRVVDVLEQLAAGLSAAEVVQDFPDLDLEDIRACLVYAATQADGPTRGAA